MDFESPPVTWYVVVGDPISKPFPHPSHVHDWTLTDGVEGSSGVLGIEYNWSLLVTHINRIGNLTTCEVKAGGTCGQRTLVDREEEFTTGCLRTQ